MELKELLENVNVESVDGPLSVDISGVTLDSRRVRNGVSVGRTGPPPDRTSTLQKPHDPFPPHAEGMKIP